MPSRRLFVAAIGVGLAGCLSESAENPSDSGDSPENSTETPVEVPESDDVDFPATVVFDDRPRSVGRGVEAMPTRAVVVKSMPYYDAERDEIRPVEHPEPLSSVRFEIRATKGEVEMPPPTAWRLLGAGGETLADADYRAFESETGIETGEFRPEQADAPEFSVVTDPDGERILAGRAKRPAFLFPASVFDGSRFAFEPPDGPFQAAEWPIDL